jgi:hypothetical protein
MFVPSDKLRRQLTQKTTDITPSQCYTTDWYLVTQALDITSKSNTTITVLSQEKLQTLRKWIADTEEKAASYKSHEIPKIIYPHLLWNNERVNTDYTAFVRHLTTAPSANTYMENKYTWNQDIINNIAWHAHCTDLQRLTGRTYKYK